MIEKTELKNPPLKEIIFSISFTESLSVDILKDFKNNSKVCNDFPTVNNGYHTDLIDQTGQPPTTTITHDGFIFSCDKPFRKILQIRKGALSFHIINQYVRFDEIINELKEYWSILNGVTTKLTVSIFSIRYLNFLELEQNEKIDDIITIHSVSPFRDDIENEFIQHRFSYSKDKSIKVNIVATNVTNNKVPGIILDIILSKKIESEFDIYDFYSMREAKNDIFFKSITDKTLKKYT